MKIYMVTETVNYSPHNICSIQLIIARVLKILNEKEFITSYLINPNRFSQKLKRFFYIKIT